jgi:WD40 repeat protein
MPPARPSDPADSNVLGRLGEKGWGPIGALAVSPDNRWLVTGDGGWSTRLCDLSDNDPASSPLFLPEGEGPVTSVAISPIADGLSLAATTECGFGIGAPKIRQLSTRI